MTLAHTVSPRFSLVGLLTILIQVREIDLITEEHHPLAQLDGRHHNSIGGSSIFTVVVKCFQQQFRSSRRGEVQSNNLVQIYIVMDIA